MTGVYRTFLLLSRRLFVSVLSRDCFLRVSKPGVLGCSILEAFCFYLYGFLVTGVSLVEYDILIISL